MDALNNNNLRILLVEDNSDDAELIVMELERAGWNINYERVQSREELSNALHSNNWDMAISDFTLPEFNGLDAMNIVKKEEPELPFIIVSGTIGEEQAVDAVLAGAGDYIMKDNLNRLIPAVSREIKNTRLERQKKEAEEQLRTSVYKYRQLFSNSVDGIVITKTNGELIDINESACQILNCNPDIAYKSNIKDFVVVERSEFVNLNSERDEKGSARKEVQFKRDNGELFPADTTSYFLTDPDGTRVVVYIIRDISEWKRNKAVLEESEQRFKALTEESVVGVYMIKDDVFDYVNPKFAEIAGYEREELVGKMTPYDVVHQEDHDIISNIIGVRERGTKGQHSYELRGIRKDGEIRHIEIYGSVVNYPQEPVIIGTLIDITDRKVYEQQLQESLKEKEVLLQEIHHRVKNNLAVISGMISMQADDLETDKERSVFFNAQMRIKAMARIHEKLYQAESLSELRFNEFLNEIVEDTVDTFTLEDSKITFKVDSDPVVLSINQALPCAQIINELLMNAIRHAFEDMNEGRVDILLKQNKGTVKLSIADNGTGLPDDFDLENPKGMGTMLINSLSNQLNANVEINTDSGTEVILTFSKE